MAVSVEGVPSNDLPDENKIKKVTSKSRSSLTVLKARLAFFLKSKQTSESPYTSFTALLQPYP